MGLSPGFGGLIRVFVLACAIGMVGCKSRDVQPAESTTAATAKPSQPYDGTYVLNANPDSVSSSVQNIMLKLDGDSFVMRGGLVNLSGKIERRDASHLVLHADMVDGKPEAEGKSTRTYQQGGGTATETIDNEPFDVEVAGEQVTLTTSGQQPVTLSRKK